MVSKTTIFDIQVILRTGSIAKPRRLRRQQVIMNPDTQVILDKISQRYADHDAKWDRRFAEQDTRWDKAFSAFTVGQENRVNALERRP